MLLTNSIAWSEKAWSGQQKQALGKHGVQEQEQHTKCPDWDPGEVSVAGVQTRKDGKNLDCVFIVILFYFCWLVD